ncbi:hypothetical protein Tco_0934058 [Tanacetum coccineum]
MTFSPSSIFFAKKDAKAQDHARGFTAPRILDIEIRGQKGAENLDRSIICPRLENHHQDKLEEQRNMKHFLSKLWVPVALQIKVPHGDKTFVFLVMKLLSCSQSLHSGPTAGAYGANYTARERFRSGILFGPHHLQRCLDFVTRCDIVNVKGKITQRDEIDTKLHPSLRNL